MLSICLTYFDNLYVSDKHMLAVAHIRTYNTDLWHDYNHNVLFWYSKQMQNDGIIPPVIIWNVETGECIISKWYFIIQCWAKYKLEAIQRWSAICRMWPLRLHHQLLWQHCLQNEGWGKLCIILQLTLTYQKFLMCISSYGQDLYSHQKLNMYIYWFLSESGYRRRRWQRRQCQMPQYNH